MAQSAPLPYYVNLGSRLRNPHYSLRYPPQVQPYYGGPPQYLSAIYGQQQYQAQPAPIITQPTMHLTQGPVNTPINDYLSYSIFTLLCCCLPLGVMALIYSVTAREASRAGDRWRAEESSRTARNLNHLALGIGLTGIISVTLYTVWLYSQ